LGNGCKYAGEFRDGSIHGQGTYYVDDRPVSKGQWVDGELVKSDNITEGNGSSIDLTEFSDK
jgi:hypothetical protein